MPVGGKLTLTVRALVTGGPGGCADRLVASAAPSALRRGSCPLESILVLRVKGGNDMFLAVSAEFRPSWMGLGLSTLEQRAPLPVASLWRAQPEAERAAGSRDASVSRSSLGAASVAETAVSTVVPEGPDAGAGDEEAAAGDESSPAGEPAEVAAQQADAVPPPAAVPEAGGAQARSPGIPWELTRLLDELSRPEALMEPGIFLVDTATILPGSPNRDPSVRLVRDALERGSRAWPEGVGPRELATALLATLAALPEPVLPEGAKALCDIASYSSVRRLCLCWVGGCVRGWRSADDGSEGFPSRSRCMTHTRWFPFNLSTVCLLTNNTTPSLAALDPRRSGAGVADGRPAGAP